MDKLDWRKGFRKTEHGLIEVEEAVITREYWESLIQRFVNMVSADLGDDIEPYFDQLEYILDRGRGGV